jgi:hypothetical protein
MGPVFAGATGSTMAVNCSMAGNSRRYWSRQWRPLLNRYCAEGTSMRGWNGAATNSSAIIQASPCWVACSRISSFDAGLEEAGLAGLRDFVYFVNLSCYSMNRLHLLYLWLKVDFVEN